MVIRDYLVRLSTPWMRVIVMAVIIIMRVVICCEFVGLNLGMEQQESDWMSSVAGYSVEGYYPSS